MQELEEKKTIDIDTSGHFLKGIIQVANILF